MTDDDHKLHEFSRIEEETENRIIRRAEQGARIIKLCWIILAAIVATVVTATAAWTVLKIQVDQNSRAIRTLWQNDYHVPLP
jgi:hypothetical protein